METGSSDYENIHKVFFCFLSGTILPPVGVEAYITE
jgi:hypothetical protein